MKIKHIATLFLLIIATTGLFTLQGKAGIEFRAYSLIEYTDSFSQTWVQTIDQINYGLYQTASKQDRKDLIPEDGVFISSESTKSGTNKLLAGGFSAIELISGVESAINPEFQEILKQINFTPITKNLRYSIDSRNKVVIISLQGIKPVSFGYDKQTNIATMVFIDVPKQVVSELDKIINNSTAQLTNIKTQGQFKYELHKSGNYTVAIERNVTASN